MLYSKSLWPPPSPVLPFSLDVKAGSLLLSFIREQDVSSVVVGGQWLLLSSLFQLYVKFFLPFVFQRVRQGNPCRDRQGFPSLFRSSPSAVQRALCSLGILDARARLALLIYALSNSPRRAASGHFRRVRCQRANQPIPLRLTNPPQVSTYFFSLA